MDKKCHWTQIERDHIYGQSTYDTECGYDNHILLEKYLDDSDFIYCPYCSGVIIEDK